MTAPTTALATTTKQDKPPAPTLEAVLAELEKFRAEHADLVRWFRDEKALLYKEIGRLDDRVAREVGHRPQIDGLSRELSALRQMVDYLASEDTAEAAPAGQA